MAAQDVRELVPRIRRAIEGPVPATGTAPLTDTQVEALAADCIADVILMTAGAWGHVIAVTDRDPEANFAIHWAVDPELKPEEESLVAAQAALTYFFTALRGAKVSERIRNEGQEWEWATNGALQRDYLKALLEQRRVALDAVTKSDPVLARYGSILAVRDKVSAAYLEPWAGQMVAGYLPA